MPRTLLLLLLLLLAQLASATTLHRDLLVHFEKDKSTLTAETITALDAFVAGLDLNDDYTLTVRGHTDSDGSQQYNEALSRARAQAVRDRLVALGADPRTVQVDFSGETDPMASNADDTGMAENRRVQVVFEQHRYADTEELRRALMEGSVQHFTLDPTIAQVVQGKAGVQLAIAANSFVDAQGNPARGPVDLELTEATGLQAMLAHQLSTQCGARLLETGGMIKVQATDARGTDVKLKGSSPMQVSLPATPKKDGMQLFLSDDGGDWAATGKDLGTRTITKWVEGPYPMPKHLAYRMPRYVEDRNGKPLKPAEPIAPKEPTAPRHESYASGRPWWGFLFPERADAKGHARYDAALQRYGAQLKRYDEQQQHYLAECDDYPAAMQRYTQRKAAWEVQKAAELAAWRTNVKRPADSTYNALSAPLQEQYLADIATWRREREASMRTYVERADSLCTADIDGLNAYVFMTSDMGWINCDRFQDVPEAEKYTIAVQDPRRGDEQAFVVFTNIRSMLGMVPDASGQLVSPRVPRKEPAVIFAYTVIDGRAHVCVASVEPGKRPELKFAPSSFAEIERLLNGLGGSPA